LPAGQGSQAAALVAPAAAPKVPPSHARRVAASGHHDPAGQGASAALPGAQKLPAPHAAQAAAADAPTAALKVPAPHSTRDVADGQ